MGYAGGTSADPTYRQIGDHAETIAIDFDPARTAYGDLLKMFWDGHQPYRRAFSRQYMSAIFVHDKEQHRLAEDSLNDHQSRIGKTLYTEILPAARFTLAEDYHQKYYLRGNRDVYRDIMAAYPDPADLTRSTAAARINGFLGGYGTHDQLDRLKGRLGLSAASEKHLANKIA